MSDILRQLTANLIPTVSGGAYQDAREVSIVWNTRRNHRFLPKFRCRMHQTRPSTLFSPVFSLVREKIGPPEARQKRPRRNEPPQATSLILCARFFLSKPQTEFAVWVFLCKSAATSQSAPLTAPLKGGALDHCSITGNRSFWFSWVYIFSRVMSTQATSTKSSGVSPCATRTACCTAM